MVVFGNYWFFIGDDHYHTPSIGSDTKDDTKPHKDGAKYELLIKNFQQYDKDFDFNDWTVLESKYAYLKTKKSINYKLGYVSIKNKKIQTAQCLCGTCIHYLFPVCNKKNKDMPFAFIGKRCIWHFDNKEIKKIITDAINKEHKISKTYCVKCINDESKSIPEIILNDQYHAPFHKKCMPQSLYKFISRFKCQNTNDFEIIKNKIIFHIEQCEFYNDIDRIEALRKFNDYIDIEIKNNFYNSTIKFGKHKGATLGWVMANDDKYIRWILNKDDFYDLKFKKKLEDIYYCGK